MYQTMHESVPVAIFPDYHRGVLNELTLFSHHAGTGREGTS